MTAKNSSDTPAIVHALMEQLAKSNAENSALQCKLAAERMITTQIFEAMKVIDPKLHDAVLKSLQGIALELEQKSGELTDFARPLTENTVATLGLQIIAACIRQFSGTYQAKPEGSSHLHLVIDNPQH